MTREYEERVLTKIKESDLSADEQDLSEIIGFENLLKLKKSNIGGASYYIQQLESHKEAVREVVLEELQRLSISQVARRLGKKSTSITKIIGHQKTKEIKNLSKHNHTTESFF